MRIELGSGYAELEIIKLTPKGVHIAVRAGGRVVAVRLSKENINLLKNELNRLYEMEPE